MKCRRCGYVFPDSENICPACGADQRLLAQSARNKKQGDSNGKPINEIQPKAQPKIITDKNSARKTQRKVSPVAKFFGAMQEDKLYKYGMAVYNGVGVTKDIDTAWSAFEELANRGNTDAMYMLAQIMLDDESPDIKEATHWLKIAAAAGNAPANNRINLLLDKGLITEEDLRIVDVGAIAAVQEVGAKIYDMNKFSSVDIFYSSEGSAWSGSGYIISDDGYILTNAHVVTDTKSGQVVPKVTAKVDGYSVRADVIEVGDYTDANPNGVDLALCKLSVMQGDMQPVVFAEGSVVHNGDAVYIIGNSLGDGSCITKGIISDKDRKLGQRNLIMTDCAINGGNSGSPLLNIGGQVIGTMCCHRSNSVVSGESVQGMNYAVPNETAFDFLKKCNKGVAVYVATKEIPSGKKTFL